MKLLLDMYRSAPKEQRDKVQLMAAEKKAKAEVITFDVVQNTLDSDFFFKRHKATWKLGSQFRSDLH